jgi:rubredoxin
MIDEMHRCPVCEYVHEEHDETPWNDVPNTYICPGCNVEKDWFETIPL